MAELHAESKAFLAMSAGDREPGSKPPYLSILNCLSGRRANSRYSGNKPPDPQPEISADAGRQMYLGEYHAFCGQFEYPGKIEEIIIPSEFSSEGIPVSVYRPTALGAPKPKVLAYFHGGGHVTGCRTVGDAFCKHISARSGAIVVNVEYRLAPEHKFPAMMEDGETVVKWILKNKTQLGAKPDSAVGVSGDSAGGNISASICHTVPGIDFQILIYPAVDWRFSFDSISKYDGNVLSKDSLAWMRSFVIRSEADVTDPRLSPLFRESFKGLPPALFVVGQCDPLVDDTYEYSKKLTAAGVHNEVVCVPGAIHLFVTLPGFFKELSEQAYVKIVEFLQRM